MALIIGLAGLLVPAWLAADPMHPGTVFRDCEECPELVVIPAGSFLMGSPASEEGRWEAEGPMHMVTIGMPFAVGVYEITYDEWEACIEGGGCNGRPNDQGWGKGDRPIIGISWDGAQGYVRWLSRETGKVYRLLSEAEWEYVARAGTTTPYHYGSTMSTRRARYSRTLAEGTAAVGTFAANGFGVHDVHGNVWEWVEDCWNQSYRGAPRDGGPWETGDCGRRVFRGGSWAEDASGLRSALRTASATDFTNIHVGFRIAQTLDVDAIQQEEADRELMRPGTVFRDCELCPEMIVVPAGNYLMGSPASEKRRSDAEGPRHRVTIGEPFAVGVYEATFAEWDACVQDGGCNGYRPDDKGWGRGKRPVIHVSWYDALRYVRWLSRETGAEYRLLSEAEWEYVARAGTTTPFHTGTTISVGQANYDGDYTYGNGRKGEDRGRTVAVGSFAANAFGLHDVHGNVWEWVEDCWNESYAGAPTDGGAWETGVCSGRVLRGGSWYSGPGFLRSAIRSGYVAGYRNDDNGFRVARTLDS